MKAVAVHLPAYPERGANAPEHVAFLAGFFSRFRRKGRSQDAGATTDAEAARTESRRFSSLAVGVISNCNESHVELGLYRRLRAMGIRRVVYAGPISVLAEPGELWKHIQAGDVDWVYGKAERPRFAPEIGVLPAGPEQLEIHGILFRYFVRQPESSDLVRFGQLQWPPPGSGREQAVEATTAGLSHPIIVIGSGIGYERWCYNTLANMWELAEQNIEGYGESPAAYVDLPPEERHLIIHPTSGGVYCSVIDPQLHRMVLLMV